MAESEPPRLRARGCFGSGAVLHQIERQLDPQRVDLGLGHHEVDDLPRQGVGLLQGVTYRLQSLAGRSPHMRASTARMPWCAEAPRITCKYAWQTELKAGAEFPCCAAK